MGNLLNTEEYEFFTEYIWDNIIKIVDVKKKLFSFDCPGSDACLLRDIVTMSLNSCKSFNYYVVN